MSAAKPESFWIERIAAGGAPRLRNPGESVEDYRVAMGWDQPKPAAAKPVMTVLSATDDHLQALMHYANSHDLRQAMNAVSGVLEQLQHMVRWHDQLKPEDIARAKAAIAKATGSAA